MMLLCGKQIKLNCSEAVEAFRSFYKLAIFVFWWTEKMWDENGEKSTVSIVNFALRINHLPCDRYITRFTVCVLHLTSVLHGISEKLAHSGTKIKDLRDIRE